MELCASKITLTFKTFKKFFNLANSRNYIFGIRNENWQFPPISIRENKSKILQNMCLASILTPMPGTGILKSAVTPWSLLSNSALDLVLEPPRLVWRLGTQIECHREKLQMDIETFETRLARPNYTHSNTCTYNNTMTINSATIHHYLVYNYLWYDIIDKILWQNEYQTQKNSHNFLSTRNQFKKVYFEITKILCRKRSWTRVVVFIMVVNIL